MKPGDLVFAKRGLHRVCGWGVVNGDYYYDQNGDPFQHSLPMDWRESREVDMPTGLQLALQTLTKMTGKTEFLNAMAQAFPEAVRSSAVEDSDREEPPEPVSVEPIKGYSLSDATQQLFIPQDRVELAIDLLRHKKEPYSSGSSGHWQNICGSTSGVPADGMPG
jgi:5-methylcytosine-specific restriction protein B